MQFRAWHTVLLTSVLHILLLFTVLLTLVWHSCAVPSEILAVLAFFDKKNDRCSVLVQVQKQIISTSGVVGALGASANASGQTKEQSPDSAGADNGSESLKAARETSLSGEPPPALFELATGLFQGRRPNDSAESSPRGSVDSANSTAGKPASSSCLIACC